MPSVNEYEVSFELRNPNTKEASIVTHTVWAYTPTDAWMQALIKTTQTSGSAEIKVHDIGPPKRLIELAAKEAEQITANLVQRIADRIKSEKG